MEQITRETFKQSFLLRWLRVMRLRYSPIPPSQTNSCLLGRQCDPFGVHVLPPPSHLSHLILDRYQDSDLPLTYVEGLSALHHSASGGGVTPNNPISPPPPGPRARSAASSSSRCARALVSMYNDPFRMPFQLFTPRK